MKEQERERDRTLRSKSVSEVVIAADCLREGGREGGSYWMRRRGGV
jgi:hypothetical protein